MRIFLKMGLNGAVWGGMGLSGDGDRGRRTTHQGRREGGWGVEGNPGGEAGSAGGDGDVALCGGSFADDVDLDGDALAQFLNVADDADFASRF